MKYILSSIAVVVLVGVGIFLTRAQYAEHTEVFQEDTFVGCDLDVVVYMSPYCKYCTAAKELLDGAKIPYNAVDVSKSNYMRKKMTEETGRTTIPQIYINEFHVGGFDQLKALQDSGKLQKFLKSCNPAELK